MKLALSILCENPLRKTGLTTLFHEFVSHALRIYPDIAWLLFAGPQQEWSIVDPRVEVVRDFPANDCLKRRLLADHFRVPAVGRKRGADLLITVGFVPLRQCLPTVMHVLSLHHLNRDNRVGFGRELYRRWIMKSSWPKADLIITNSQCAARQITSVYPEFQSRLVTSYEGLQHEQFNPTAGQNETQRLKSELGLSPGYLLWVSNFYPYKQAELLVEAYARLELSQRERHPLVMVGGDWENVLALLKTRVKQLGLTDQVKFLGWIPDQWLAPLYRHALAFCLPSREETFGRCVIEAMACGTPCLVNDIPIMHEVAGGAAVIVDFQRREQATHSLRQLMEDTALREQLSRQGRANAQRFRFDRLTTERVEAMRRMLSQIRIGKRASGLPG
jgi:glycosyltransferase involved in cell wall biosynthesis